ncbi:hypothetical protein HHI36_021465 [Cryptolaemus montrouzieri]|uniref:BLOC-1-related complex subunit 6 C-terminal helix domain-containing protein n=1 Tax=Cryptolaemus montrouzieri TaxID=559131 RepID=A0ABD2MXC3_9CUCU
MLCMAIGCIGSGIAALIQWLSCCNSVRNYKEDGFRFSSPLKRMSSTMEKGKQQIPPPTETSSNSQPPTQPLKKPDEPEEMYIPDNDDIEEEMSAQMTQSYSEISFKSGASPGDEDDSYPPSVGSLPLVEQMLQRPATLSYDRNFPLTKPMPPLNLDGTVHREGNMTHFVTDNLEYKIKLSSPVSKKGDTPSSGSKSGTPLSIYRTSTIPQVGLLDLGLLQDLEYEAQRMATSIDSLTENLCEILQSISSLTAQNVDVYKDAVTKMSEAMDSNIKSMYTMMAKTEEVTVAMKSVQGYAQRIKDIRRLVDLFESYL